MSKHFRIPDHQMYNLRIGALKPISLLKICLVYFLFQLEIIRLRWLPPISCIVTAAFCHAHLWEHASSRVEAEWWLAAIVASDSVRLSTMRLLVCKERKGINEWTSLHLACLAYKQWMESGYMNEGNEWMGVSRQTRNDVNDVRSNPFRFFSLHATYKLYT